MKKLFTILVLATSFFFVACDNNQPRTMPNPVSDTANVYWPGKDTLVSSRDFEKKAYQKQITTCAGDVKKVTRYHYTTKKDSVVLTLQGVKMTPDEIRKTFNPSPIVDNGNKDNSDSSDNGSIGNGNSSSHAGFLGAGLPDWFWQLLAAILVGLILWLIIRALTRDRNDNHTHNVNHTGNVNHNHSVVGLATHAEALAASARAQDSTANAMNEANRLNEQRLQFEREQAALKNNKTGKQKVTFNGLGNQNTINVNCDRKELTNAQDIEFIFLQGKGDQNNIVVTLK